MQEGYEFLVTEDFDPRMLVVISMALLFMASLLLALVFVWLRGRRLKRRDLEIKKRENLEERLERLDEPVNKEKAGRD